MGAPGQGDRIFDGDFHFETGRHEQGQSHAALGSDVSTEAGGVRPGSEWVSVDIER
jgi:hypothetical protein